MKNTHRSRTGKTAIKMGMLFLFFAFFTPAVSAIDALDILSRAEEQVYPARYYAVMTMNTHKPEKRDTSMTMEIYYQKGDGSFMEITDPPRSRGIRFLQKEASLYMFNPRSNSRNALRLSPESSFQGSVFSNNDVTNPKYSDDYNASLLENETIAHPDLGNTECYVVLGTAKNNKSPYGKIKMWAAMDSLIPLKMEYYAKSGLLFKTMDFYELREMAGEIRPSRMRMYSLEMEDSYSEVIIEAMKIPDTIPASRFSQSSLVR